MRKLFCIILLGLFGCQDSVNIDSKGYHPTIETIYNTDCCDIKIYQYTIDGCEYIGNVTGNYRDFLTHKGNCEFCEQRNKK